MTVMNEARSWMLYGAAGFTGALIARHAHERGHRALLSGRSAPAVTALANELDLPHRALTLDDPDALRRALTDVEVVLNALATSATQSAAQNTLRSRRSSRPR